MASQYALAHEIYTAHYSQSAQSEWNSTLWACDALHNSPSLTPYCEWLAQVTMHLTHLMQAPITDAGEATSGQTNTLFINWSKGLSALEAAAEVHAVHELHLLDLEEAQRWEEEEDFRRHCEDIADTYASIEADLLAGWRAECEEMGMAA